MIRFTYYKTFIFCDTLFSRDCPSKFIHNTVDGLIFVGYQFSWFSWRVWSTNSSANEIANFCMNYEGKYYGHKFWTPRMRDFCSIHENWYPRKLSHPQYLIFAIIISMMRYIHLPEDIKSNKMTAWQAKIKLKQIRIKILISQPICINNWQENLHNYMIF